MLNNEKKRAETRKKIHSMHVAHAIVNDIDTRTIAHIT